MCSIARVQLSLFLSIWERYHDKNDSNESNFRWNAMHSSERACLHFK
jgi:hypothetical protein